MKTLIMVVLTAALITGVAYAVDFSTYSTDELLQMRGTMQAATIEERTALHTELTKRVAEMTPEQKQEFAQRPANAGRGMARGMGRGMARGMEMCNGCPYRTY